MEYNAEQLSQIQRSKLDGQDRLSIELTAEQRRDLQTVAAKEIAGQDENIAHFHKIRTAAEQPGFFGDVRRSILHARRPTQELAAAVDIEPSLLSDFRAGEAELPPAALNRLIEVLGLRLMQEIPH